MRNINRHTQKRRAICSIIPCTSRKERGLRKAYTGIKDINKGCVVWNVENLIRNKSCKSGEWRRKTGNVSHSTWTGVHSWLAKMEQSFCILHKVSSPPILSTYIKRLMRIISLPSHTHTHTQTYIYIYIYKLYGHRDDELLNGKLIY